MFNNRFELHITDIDTFDRFVEIIRGEDTSTIMEMTARLQMATAELEAAVNATTTTTTPQSRQERIHMNPALDALAAAVSKATAVEASATTLINGISDRIQVAVDAAIANGATAEQLAPVQAEADALSASADALSAAVLANTPGA